MPMMRKEEGKAGVAEFVSQPSTSDKQGGFRATIFIFIMVALENMGFIANMVSMVLYFTSVMHFDLSGSATTLTNFAGTAFMLALLGGFISDTYLSRLNTCLVFGAIELMGYILLTTQAHFQSLQPNECGKSQCVEGVKALIFYSSISLIALGAGGVRGSLPALGGDQFNKNDPEERKYQSCFFNWLFLSINIGAIVGVTIIVWVSKNRGWDSGFFISMMAAFLGLAIVALGRPYYCSRVPGESPFTMVIQVFVVAFQNRNLQLPENQDMLYETHDQEAAIDVECLPHTNQFRSLDKAAILSHGLKPKAWRVCSVTQVEQVKILTKMMPIILSTILMNTCFAQLQTFSIHQGTLMNTHIGSFDVPSASIPAIPLIFMSLLMPVYEFVFVPITRRLTGRLTGITHLQRAGVGLVLSFVAMVIAGCVEVKRKLAYNHHGYKISIFWLSFQFALFGIADMFTFVGMMDFFYSEAPAGMKSLSTSFSWLSVSIGYFLSSIFVEFINAMTSKFTMSKRGWLEGHDMNKNHLELFFLLLAIISCINFVNYICWASWYKYNKEVSSFDNKKTFKGGNYNKEEEKGKGKNDGARSY